MNYSKVLKYLKLFNIYRSELYVSLICKKFNIKNWSINSEGLVDVDGNVYLYDKRLYKLPLKFGKVTGYFDCRFNQLTNLKGSPIEVGGDFYCNSNKLKSLEGGPRYVGGDFCCNNNKLISLEGSPEKVGRSFLCNYNYLINLEGGLKHVGVHFNCSENRLVNLEGVPDFIDGDFYCYGNLIFRIWKLFEDYSKIELFNYYDIVREFNGKPVIVLARLNQFLEDIGKQPVEKVEGYINI